MPACTIEGICTIRRRAKTALETGNAGEAITLFEAFACQLNPSEDTFVNEWAWLLSDHSYALYTAGDFRRCHRLAASHLEPYPRRLAQILSKDAPVLKALSHNATMCQKALEKAYANFHASTACTISGSSEAFGVPQSVLDEPARSACLEIKPGKMDTESGLYEGGPVFWVESRNDRVNRRSIGQNVGEAPCNLQTVSFSRVDDSIHIMLRGGSRLQRRDGRLQLSRGLSLGI